MSGKLITSSITSRGTTTIPQEIRFLLGLETADEVSYTPQGNGVLIAKVEKASEVCPCCKGTGRCKIEKESDSS